MGNAARQLPSAAPSPAAANDTSELPPLPPAVLRALARLLVADLRRHPPTR